MWRLAVSGRLPSRPAHTPRPSERHLGHNNVYIGYGDEPPPRWVAAKRHIFKTNQEAGSSSS